MSDDTIVQIKSRADIVEIVSSYIKLKKAGRIYKGLCPFHSEKTPSFNVDPDKQFFHCFGCGANGDVFGFVQQYDDLSFHEAMKRLAGRYGVIIKPFSEEFPSSQENPNATADAFMTKVRGFNLDIVKDMYDQHRLKHRDKNEFATTVRFKLPNGSTWERLIDEHKIKTFEKKAHFFKSFKNSGWIPPGQSIEENDIVYITEGIFKSLAFHHLKMKTIAAMTSNNCPFDIINENKGKGVIWVLASDFDNAGKKSAAKYKEEIETLGEIAYVAFPESVRLDWDDLFREKRLDQEYLNDSLWRGRYFLCENHREKAFWYWAKFGKGHHIYENKNALWKYENNRKNDLYELRQQVEECWKIESADEYKDHMSSFFGNVIIELISNCVPDFLYIEKDALTDEQFYYFNVKHAHNHVEQKIQVEGAVLESPSPFKKALLNKTAGGMFSGQAADLEKLKEKWFKYTPRTVSSIPFVGYHKETNCYVFPEFGFFKGKYFPVNDDGFFEYNKQSIKCGLRSIDIHYTEKLQLNWFDDYFEAFSFSGVMLMSWWLGGFFAEQIRKIQKSYPFFELTGDQGAGKSTQIEFMWRASGRSGYEGFDPSKSTPAGRARNFQQVSNLPVVLLEGDRNGDSKRNLGFDFDELKTAYNGRGIRSMGVKRRGSETEEPPFRGACLISQNAEVDGSEALLSRIVHAHCTRFHHNEKTRLTARKLEGMNVDDLSGFLVTALKNEEKLLADYLIKFAEIEKEFAERAEGIQSRLIKNHAQIAAWVYQLPTIFGKIDDYFCDEVKEFIWERCQVRQTRVGGDHPLVTEFWETFDYLLTRGSEHAKLNHSVDQNIIALNFNEFVTACTYYGQNKYNISELKQLLKNGRNREFLERKTIHSAVNQKKVNCWTFRNEPNTDKKAI